MTEQAHDFWSGDRLGRKQDAVIIMRMLTNRATRMANAGDKGAVVLNLDARWGEGKTFMLERMQKTFAAENKAVVTINAWESDYGDDPLPALAGPILRCLIEKQLGGLEKEETDTKRKTFKQVTAKLAVAAGKSGLKKTLSFAFGDDGTNELIAIASDAAEAGTEQLIEEAAARLLVQDQAATKAISDFKKEIAARLAELKPINEGSPIRLIVLLDELDRCRPDYAVAMLERVKHLFDIEGLAFVIATDTTQLRASIKGVYGAEFDAQTYLRRFFPLTYRLSEPSLINFVNAWIEQQGGLEQYPLHNELREETPTLLAGILYGLDCSTRDNVQVLARLEMVIDALPKERIFMPLLALECASLHMRGLSARHLRKQKNASFSIDLKTQRYSLNDWQRKNIEHEGAAIENDVSNLIISLLSVIIEGWESLDNQLHGSSSRLEKYIGKAALASCFGYEDNDPEINIPEIVARCGASLDETA